MQLNKEQKNARKKAYVFTVPVWLVMVFVLTLLCGCKSMVEITENLKYKTIARSTGVYGIKFKTSYDAQTNSIAPEYDAGSVLHTHHSVPVLPGQGAIISDVDYFWWSDKPSHKRTTIIFPIGSEMAEFMKKHPDYFKDLSEIMNVKNGKVEINQ